MKVGDVQAPEVAEYNFVAKNFVVNNYLAGVQNLTEDIEINEKAWLDMEDYFNQDMDAASFTWTVKKEGSTEDFSNNFTLNNTGKLQTLTVKTGTKAGVYTFVLTYGEEGGKQATATFTVTLNNPVLVPVSEYWYEGNLVVRADKDGNLEANLSKAFEEIGDGAEVIFSTTEKSEDDIKFASDRQTISLKNPKELPIGQGIYEISYQLVNSVGEAVTEKVVCNVIFYNPIKELTLSKTELSMNIGQELNLLETLGMNLVATSGEVIIEDGELKVGENNIYGISETSIVFVDESNYLTINNGVVTCDDPGLAGTKKVTVKVQITNTWKTIEKEITIMVSPRQ